MDDLNFYVPCNRVSNIPSRDTVLAIEKSSSCVPRVRSKELVLGRAVFGPADSTNNSVSSFPREKNSGRKLVKPSWVVFYRVSRV